jgi:hypothetical protein
MADAPTLPADGRSVLGGCGLHGPCNPIQTCHCVPAVPTPRWGLELTPRSLPLTASSRPLDLRDEFFVEASCPRMEGGRHRSYEGESINRSQTEVKQL